MNRDDFPELAILWQEQADPGQQRRLQRLAAQIKARARRQRLVDILLSLAFLAPIFVILAYPTLVPVRLGAGLTMLVLAWAILRRRRMTSAAAALDQSDPRAFFAAAIDNARSEWRFSLAGIGAMTLIFAIWLFLILGDQGVQGFDFVPDELFGVHRVKIVFLALAAIAIYALLIRASVRLHERVRRFETMAQEWDEEGSQDPADQP